DAAVVDGGDRRRGELVHRAPPLEHDQRLDAGVAALAGWDRMTVGLLALDEPSLARPGENALARFVLSQPGELSRLRAHASVEADHDQLGEPVHTTDLEVRRVVPGSD